MNEWWQIFLAILASIGIGSIISGLIAMTFQRKKLRFETKLIKYTGLICAYYNHIKNPTDEASKQDYVSAQKNVELIGATEVVKISKEFYKATPEQGPAIIEKLILAMRADLSKLFFT